MTKINEKYDLENNPSIVYERIQKAWENAGLNSAAEFSMATRNNPNEPGGISPATISKWKKRGEIPSTKSLAIVCDVCGCDMDYLLGRIDTFKYENHSIQEKTGLSEDAISLLAYYKSLQDKGVPGDPFHGPSPASTIPDLISYILTRTYWNESVYSEVNILSEIVSAQHEQHKIRALIDMTPEFTRKICSKVYADVLNIIGYPSEDNYRTNVRLQFNQHQTEIESEYPGCSSNEILEKMFSLYTYLHALPDKELADFKTANKMTEMVKDFFGK